MYLALDQYSTIAAAPVLPSWRVETLTEKGSGTLNEDVLFCRETSFGVFDGATSLGKQALAGGLTGGLIAARLAARTFAENDRDLPQLAQQANLKIGDAMISAGMALTQRDKLWSTSAAVVRVVDGYFSWCQTGDSAIAVVMEDGGFQLLPSLPEQDRETLGLWQKCENHDNLPIHDLLAEQIKQVRLGMNIRYGVLNGEQQAMDFVQTGRYPLEGVSAVLLFTDGLFLPQSSPYAEPGWEFFSALYQDGGLSAIHRQVRAMQAADPHCRRYPRFKQHDDIAAIAIRF